MLLPSRRAISLPVLLGAAALALGCSSTQGAAGAGPDDVQFAAASDQLSRQIKVKAVEAEFWASGEDFVRLTDWFFNVGEPAYEALLDMAAGASAKAREVALAVVALRADRRLLERFREEVPEPGPDEDNLRMGYGRALLFMGDMAGAGILIEGLENPARKKRRMAHQALQRATNNNLPYDPDGTEEERAEGVRIWRRWLEAQTSDPMLDD